MPQVQARFFLLAKGDQIPNCTVDSSTKLIAEIIMNSEYPTHEEVDMMEVTIAKTDNTCVKKFRWTGACALKLGVTYTIDTPIFGPISAGNYVILLGFSGAPLTKTLAECGINLSEVNC